MIRPNNDVRETNGDRTQEKNGQVPCHAECTPENNTIGITFLQISDTIKIIDKKGVCIGTFLYEIRKTFRKRLEAFVEWSTFMRKPTCLGVPS